MALGSTTVHRSSDRISSKSNSKFLDNYLVDSALSYLDHLSKLRRQSGLTALEVGTHAEWNWKESAEKWAGRGAQIFRTHSTGVDGPSGGGSLRACRQYDLIVEISGFYILFEVECSDIAEYKEEQCFAQILAMQNWAGPAVYCRIDGNVKGPTVKKWTQTERQTSITGGEDLTPLLQERLEMKA